MRSCTDSENCFERGANMGEMESRFMERIQEEYDRYLQNLHSLSPDELIKRAEEIAGMRTVYTLLVKREVKPDPEQVKYLLKFGSPLSAIADSFGLVNLCSLREELEHQLWEMTDRQDQEDGYGILPTEAEDEETEAEP